MFSQERIENREAIDDDPKEIIRKPRVRRVIQPERKVSGRDRLGRQRPIGGEANFGVRSDCVSSNPSNLGMNNHRNALESNRQSLHRHLEAGDGVKPTGRAFRRMDDRRCDQSIINSGCIPKGATTAMRLRRRRSVGEYHPNYNFVHVHACMCGHMRGHICASSIRAPSARMHMHISHRNLFPSGLKLRF